MPLDPSEFVMISTFEMSNVPLVFTRMAEFTPKTKELKGYLKRYAALVTSGAQDAVLKNGLE